MSPRDDEFDDVTNTPIVGATSLGRGGSGDNEVAQFLIELRNLGSGAAPEPSREVAALLTGAPLVWRRRARIASRTLVAAAVAVSALVFAAARHSLPAPAQRVVSNVVNVVTPFHISPDPVQLPSPAPAPTPGPQQPRNRPEPTRTHASPTEPDDGPTGDDNGGGPQPGGSDGGAGEDGSSGAAGTEDSGSDDGGATASTGSQPTGSYDGAGDYGGTGTATGVHRPPSDDGTRADSGTGDGARHHDGGDN